MPQKWLTLEGGERTHMQNNIKIKSEQLKLSKTDLSNDYKQSTSSMHGL
jgi:hypothetical protein